MKKPSEPSSKGSALKTPSGILTSEQKDKHQKKTHLNGAFSS
jgi:hypothetical protein